MTSIDSQNRTTPRAGKSFRNNPDRFFHVMAEGWFILTREGERGPFTERKHAQNYLDNHLIEIKGDEDPSTGWRL